MTVAGLNVTVRRKQIKNLHIGVYPPDGHVRVAAPSSMSDGAIRTAVVMRLRWITQQQRRYEAQAREAPRQMVSGETHLVFGRPYRLYVLTGEAPTGVDLRSGRRLELRVRPEWDSARRARLLDQWHRAQLRALLSSLVPTWKRALHLGPVDWRIRRMKTKWGTCTRDARRIWLNSELAKKPPECAEYVVVHELAHLIIRTHDERFVALMDRYLPRWRFIRKRLNDAPLADAHGVTGKRRED